MGERTSAIYKVVAEIGINEMSDSDERFLSEAVRRVNKNILKQFDEAEDSIEKYDRESKKLQAHKDKIFGSYEENLITSEELLERKEALNREIRQIQENKEREIESIKVILTKEMIQFLNNGGDPPEASPPSFSFCWKRALLELELVVKLSEKRESFITWVRNHIISKIEKLKTWYE